jgi:hypothetical protein
MSDLTPEEQATLAREQDEIEAEALADGEVWWSDGRRAGAVPVLPGDLVVHLPENERAAAVAYQNAGLPYYPSDEDGL